MIEELGGLFYGIKVKKSATTQELFNFNKRWEYKYLKTISYCFTKRNPATFNGSEAGSRSISDPKSFVDK